MIQGQKLYQQRFAAALAQGQTKLRLIMGEDQIAAVFRKGQGLELGGKIIAVGNLSKFKGASVKALNLFHPGVCLLSQKRILRITEGLFDYLMLDDDVVFVLHVIHGAVRKLKALHLGIHGIL